MYGSQLPMDVDSLYRFSWITGAADGISKPKTFESTEKAPVYVAQQMVPLCSVHPFVDSSNKIFRNAALGLCGGNRSTDDTIQNPTCGLPSLKSICLALLALAQDDDDDGSSSSSSDTVEEIVDTTKVLKKSKKKATINGHGAKAKKTLSRLKGQRVIARCNLDGYYYAGHILSCNSAEKAVVDFDELDRSIVHSKHVIPISGSIARPFLKEGDAVLVLVKNAITGLHCHVPGLVVMAPRSDMAQAKFYRILAYNRRYVSAMRYQLVKISAAKFRASVDYIIERAKQLGLTAVAPPQVPHRHQNRMGTSQSMASNDDIYGATTRGVRKTRLRSANGSLDLDERNQEPQQVHHRRKHHHHHHHHHHHNQQQKRFV